MLCETCQTRAMDTPGKKRKNRPLARGADPGITRANTAPIAGIFGLVLTGCASAPPSAGALAANDPYEQTNRQTFIFNGKIDRYVVVPSFAVYFFLVPDPG